MNLTIGEDVDLQKTHSELNIVMKQSMFILFS